MSATQLPSSVILPEMVDGGNIQASTSSSGTAFTALASQACKQVTIANNTGAAIEVQQDGSGPAFPVFDQTYYTFYGLANSNQLAVRRVDQAVTVVTVNARWEN